MIQLLCDSCKRPIDPTKDNHINVGNMRIFHSGKMGEFILQFCGKGCFVTWLNKHGEPSAIISASSIGGPSA